MIEPKRLTCGKVNLLTLTIDDPRLNNELKSLQYKVFEKLLFAFIPLITILIVTTAVAKRGLDMFQIIQIATCTVLWVVGLLLKACKLQRYFYVIGVLFLL